MNLGLGGYLFIGAILMCIVNAMQMNWYGIAPWKSVFVSIAIAFTGLLCCELWYYFENGEWGGKSFFGGVFFAPITFMLVSKLLRIPYLYSLDYCATAGCLVLSVLKVDCLIGGCCKGIVLYKVSHDTFVRFPSQAVEVTMAGILTIALLFISKRERFRGRIYPITLVVYGAIRFVLNLFRDDWERTKQMNLLLPLGCIWSLVAIAVGLAWMFCVKMKETENH